MVTPLTLIPYDPAAMASTPPPLINVVYFFTPPASNFLTHTVPVVILAKLFQTHHFDAFVVLTPFQESHLPTRKRITYDAGAKHKVLNFREYYPNLDEVRDLDDTKLSQLHQDASADLLKNAYKMHGCGEEGSITEGFVHSIRFHQVTTTNTRLYRMKEKRYYNSLNRPSSFRDTEPSGDRRVLDPLCVELGTPTVIASSPPVPHSQKAKTATETGGSSHEDRNSLMDELRKYLDVKKKVKSKSRIRWTLMK